jgi:phospholipase C
MPNMVKHVVIFGQENHTIDNYFDSMARWGERGDRHAAATQRRTGHCRVRRNR